MFNDKTLVCERGLHHMLLDDGQAIMLNWFHPVQKTNKIVMQRIISSLSDPGNSLHFSAWNSSTGKAMVFTKLY